MLKTLFTKGNRFDFLSCIPSNSEKCQVLYRNLSYMILGQMLKYYLIKKLNPLHPKEWKSYWHIPELPQDCQNLHPKKPISPSIHSLPMPIPQKAERGVSRAIPPNTWHLLEKVQVDLSFTYELKNEIPKPMLLPFSDLNSNKFSSGAESTWQIVVIASRVKRWITIRLCSGQFQREWTISSHLIGEELGSCTSRGNRLALRPFPTSSAKTAACIAQQTLWLLPLSRSAMP